jgi:hypothetical protein
MNSMWSGSMPCPVVGAGRCVYFVVRFVVEPARVERAARVAGLDPVAVRVPLERDVVDFEERRVRPEGVTAARSLSKSLSIRLFVLCASRRSAPAVRVSSL